MMPLTIRERNLLVLLNRCLPELEAARFWVEGDRLTTLTELVGQLKVVCALAKAQTIERSVPVCVHCKKPMTEYHGVFSTNLPNARIWNCECVDKYGDAVRRTLSKDGE